MGPAAQIVDLKIDQALTAWIAGRRVLGVMGGHALARGSAGYADAAGWCYWSYKTHTRDDWNFRHQVESGVVKL